MIIFKSSITSKTSSQKRHLPFYAGGIACGLFGIAEDFTENNLSLDEKFSKNLESTFYVRASGDSMLPEIKNEDILIVDRSLKVLNKSIVAVFFNGAPMCKQIILEGNKKILHPLNTQYQDIQINEDDELVLFGVVIGLARDFY